MVVETLIKHPENILGLIYLYNLLLKYRSRNGCSCVCVYFGSLPIKAKTSTEHYIDYAKDSILAKFNKHMHEPPGTKYLNTV